MSRRPIPLASSRFRRVVTFVDDHGRSAVAIDGGGWNLGTLHELWRADPHATADAVTVDRAADPVTIVPSPGGSVFRFVEIEPESRFDGLDHQQRCELTRAAFAAIGSDNALVDQALHPAMHETDTLDYIVVLRGTLTMLLEQGEVNLEPFDVVVQRGTNHAWINRSETPALLAAVLIAPAPASKLQTSQEMGQ